MNDELLKECPFCGSPGELSCTEDDPPYWFGMCQNDQDCGCWVMTDDGNKEGAIERWNRRVNVP